MTDSPKLYAVVHYAVNEHRGMERYLLGEGSAFMDDRALVEKDFMKSLMSIGKRVVVRDNPELEAEAGVSWILPHQVTNVYFFERE